MAGDVERGIVYGIRGTDGAMRYVGQTRGKLQDRWYQHLRDSKRPTLPVHKWMGAEIEADRFPTWEVLERPSLAELNAREEFYIKEYQATLYNVAERLPGETIIVDGDVLTSADVIALRAEVVRLREEAGGVDANVLAIAEMLLETSRCLRGAS